MPQKSIWKKNLNFCPFSPNTHLFEIHKKLQSHSFIQKTKVQTCSELIIDYFKSKKQTHKIWKATIKVAPHSFTVRQKVGRGMAAKSLNCQIALPGDQELVL